MPWALSFCGYGRMLRACADVAIVITLLVSFGTYSVATGTFIAQCLYRLFF